MNMSLRPRKVRPELPVQNINDIIKAKIPYDKPALAGKIRRFMTHGRDHLTRETSRCRKGTKCIYGFPHPITSSTSVDDDGRVHYIRKTEEDRWIAPHIPELIDELDCHIFVDVVFTVAVFTYLYKYLYKGPDRTQFQLNHTEHDHVDELKDYVEGRYLSAHEAAWRILGFHITSKTPSVACLPLHLPEGNIPRYSGGQSTNQSSTSLLIRYFNRPLHPSFDALSYCQYFKEHVLYKWDAAGTLGPDDHLEQPIPGCVRQKVSPRRVGCKVTRIRVVSPTSGELFYLRCLLIRQPARSYAQLRTVDGITFDSFHEAAIRLGLFANENEGQYTLTDAIASFCTPAQIRFLFSRVVLEGFPAVPLWDEFRLALAQDFMMQTHSEERAIDLCLLALAAAFQEGGRALAHFGLPQPRLRCPEVVSEIEAFAGRQNELLLDAQTRYTHMNAEQKRLFDWTTNAARTYSHSGQPHRQPLFLEGQPGRGKTFVVDAICSALRADNLIVLVVGSSALAATLYEGGRTAHNVFQIPVSDVRLSLHFTDITRSTMH
jgi:PIF1-like helicase